MKRHIAKLRHTDRRCVVLYMQIPGRSDHALIAPVEGLSAHIEQLLMEIVESPEGQADPILANVMGRRLVGNTGRSMMQVLHEASLLEAVHIDQVIMYPQPNMAYPLRQILEGMGQVLPPAASEVTDADEKFNRHTTNVNGYAVEERVAIARNLLGEASDLQDVANRKRLEAYRIAPELAPAATPAALVEDAPAGSGALSVEGTLAVKPKRRAKPAKPASDA